MKHRGDPGLHRAPQPGRRRATPVGKRRADVRPRYGRIAVLAAAVTVSGISVLGGFGVLPNGPEDASAEAGLVTGTDPVGPADSGDPREPAGDSARGSAGDGSPGRREATDRSTGQPASRTAVVRRTTTALPADSGSGRRIVFSEGAQRVWLVDDADDVVRTYLVSGSATDNLDPGTYEVYSRSRWAVGIDDSGTMQYFVRFTRGPSGAAIGFHTIPVDDGSPVQTTAELGTPLSHGCIRQRTSDAIALWEYAPVGTTVVVV